MTKRITVGAAMLILLGAFIVLIYPKPFASKHERKVLYWTDPMIPGDRSDRPGKSPMGMDRTPVYADETVSSGQPGGERAARDRREHEASSEACEIPQFAPAQAGHSVPHPPRRPKKARRSLREAPRSLTVWPP